MQFTTITLLRLPLSHILVNVDKVLFETVSLLCQAPRTVLSVAKSTSSMILMKMCTELTSMEHGIIIA